MYGLCMVYVCFHVWFGRKLCYKLFGLKVVSVKDL